MELRVDTGARATKDLDPVLRAGLGDFTATRTELEAVHAADLVHQLIERIHTA